MRPGSRFWAVLILALAGCAETAPGPALPPPPAHANGQVLWRIVHQQCVPGQQSRGAPAPCAVVAMPDGEAHGYVLLKDRDGVSQYLLMPTARITGIEDPAVLAPGATNYFAKAWDARHFVEDRLGHPLDRAQVSVAVNSPYGRSQDQLHLHIDCLDKDVGSALSKAAVPHTGRWADHVVTLKGHHYRVRWLDAAALEGDNPFRLLAQAMPGARHDMGAWTLALAGGVRAGGAQGFYVLADRADPAAGDYGSAEELQDHACRL